MKIFIAGLGFLMSVAGFAQEIAPVKDVKERNDLSLDVNKYDKDKNALHKQVKILADTLETMTIQELIPIAQRNTMMAAVILGKKYSERRNFVEAVRWYRKAAKQGDINAQHNLAVMYDDGDGVRQDKVEAIGWYRKAAEQGDADAQNRLGIMYENGEGAKPNKFESVRWFRMAAEQGNAEAQFNLGINFDTGKFLLQDKGEAARWYQKAAEQGIAAAQFNLASMYFNGEGVTKDKEKSIYWARKAADQGNEKAKKVLIKFDEK